MREAVFPSLDGLVDKPVLRKSATEQLVPHVLGNFNGLGCCPRGACPLSAGARAMLARERRSRNTRARAPENTHTHTRAHAHTHAGARTHIHTDAHHLRARTQLHTNTNVHAHTHTHTQGGAETRTDSAGPASERGRRRRMLRYLSGAHTSRGAVGLRPPCCPSCSSPCPLGCSPCRGAAAGNSAFCLQRGISEGPARP